MFPLTRTKLTATLFAATAAVLLAPPAAEAAYPQRGLYWLVGEIRGQIAEVQARADVVLPYCGGDAADVRRELDRLCRDLDRFERTLARGISCPNDLARLCSIAERIQDHACELKDELGDAIEDIRYPRGHRHQVGRIAPPEPRREHVVIGGRHIVSRQSRGLSFAYGNRGLQFAYGFRPQSPFHQVVGQPVVPQQPIVAAGPSPFAVAELVESVDRLHYLTAQLHRVLRG